MTADQRYALSSADNERIFRKRIVPQRLAAGQPRQRPAVVFVIGQQGAGKTSVARHAAAALNRNGGFVEIDSDLFKPYHPWARRLLERDDRLANAQLAPDARIWRQKAEQYARSHQLNALVHETAQDPGYLAETLRAYRYADYRVEILALGVPRAMSEQGILNRYHEQRRDRGHGRLTVPEKADRSYRNIPETAEMIERDRLADRVAVYRRGETGPRYANALDEHGEWQYPRGFRQAIETERERPWTRHETRDFRHSQRKLRDELGTEWQPQLDKIDDLAAPHLHLDARHREPRARGPRQPPGPGLER